jgi:Tol biopolymer transport system component
MSARAQTVRRVSIPLCLAALVGSAPVGSTKAGGRETAAGGRIVFVSGPTNLAVRTINADGTGLAVLTQPRPGGHSPTWVEQGRAIAFAGADGGLWVMRPSGDAARRVARASDSSSLSPSGRRVAILTDAGNLKIARPDGRTLRLVRLKLRPGESIGDDVANWAPNGQRVAFYVDGETRSSEYERILVVDLASGSVHSITPPGTSDDSPSWSPDSRRIAFLTGNDTEDLDVMNGDGSGRNRLARNVSSNAIVPFTWSPDGRWVAFMRGHGGTVGSRPRSIFVVAARGGRETRVASARAINALAWSPDDTRLAFSSTRGIAVARIGGATVRSTRRGASSSLSWAPGSRILFAEGQSLYSTSAEGRATRLLTSELNDGWPVWAPNGRAVAFVRGASSHGPEIVPGEVWTMKTDGSVARRLGAGYEPSWSPDSRRLVYVRKLPGGPAIIVQERAGATGQIVARGSSPAWSPDGKSIAFLQDRTHVGVVFPDGSNGRVLVDGANFTDVNGVASERYFGPVVWSPRGGELAVATALEESDGTAHALRVRVADLSGATRALPLFAESGLDWSADGKVLVGASESGISTIAANGSSQRTIVHAQLPVALSAPAWSPDGRLIAYNWCRHAAVCELRVASADGLTRRRVVKLAAPQLSFDFGTNFGPRWQPR